MSINSYYLNTEGSFQTDLGDEAIGQAYESKSGVLWVDIEGIEKTDIQPLEQIFRFHALTVEDCASERLHTPKVDDFNDYIFLIVHGINHQTESDIVETSQLEMFIGPGFVVTHHNLPMYSIEAVKSRLEKDHRPVERGTDFLAHFIVDALIDNVLPTIDQMGDVIDSIEEEAIHNPSNSTLDGIQRLKRSVIQLHRVMSPQKEMLYNMSQGNYGIIGEGSRMYYRNVYDHILRIEELNQNIRERADNALATYMSSIANRQNETMRILSIVAAIFLPLSLLAGIYGMNFEYMPELGWHWGYFTVLGVMGVAIIGVMWWLWLRNVISWGRKKAGSIVSFRVEPRKLLWLPERKIRRSDGDSKAGDR